MEARILHETKLSLSFQDTETDGSDNLIAKRLGEYVTVISYKRMLLLTPNQTRKLARKLLQLAEDADNVKPKSKHMWNNPPGFSITAPHIHR
jgi:hypothetical protein